MGTLGRQEARAFYDRFGTRQDRQAFYEDRAIDELVRVADFESASAVFELGCGTGRVARMLLRNSLPGDARYFGCDISSTMIDIARARLREFGERVRLEVVSGDPPFDLSDGVVDRFVSLYVFDLLSEPDIAALIDEARRVLRPDGRLCVVSLTFGSTPLSRLVAGAWRTIFRARPTLVGGCRPIGLGRFLSTSAWTLEHRRGVVRLGIPSEVVIARPQSDPARDLASKTERRS